MKNKNFQVKKERRRDSKSFLYTGMGLFIFWPLEMHFIQRYDPTDFTTGTKNNSYNPPTDRRNIQSSFHEIFQNNAVPNLLLENSYRLGDPDIPNIKKFKTYFVVFKKKRAIAVISQTLAFR